jgi:hypothetical protein
VKKFLIAVAALAAIGVGAALFMQTSAIVVEGNSRYSSEEIIAASQLKPEGVLFLTDLSGVAAKRVTAAFPYIADTKIIYRIPDTIVIRVTELEPVAYVTCLDGTVALLAPDGRVLELNPTAPEGIRLDGIFPQAAQVGSGESLTGLSQMDSLLGVEDGFAVGLKLSDADRERLSYALEIIEELQAQDLTRYVTYLNASILNPQFDLNKKFVVDMGMRQNTVGKIETLIRAVKNMEPGSAGVIDMSVPGEAHYIPK